jgi:hypothetical protein
VRSVARRLAASPIEDIRFVNAETYYLVGDVLGRGLEEELRPSVRIGRTCRAAPATLFCLRGRPRPANQLDLRPSKESPCSLQPAWPTGARPGCADVAVMTSRCACRLLPANRNTATSGRISRLRRLTGDILERSERVGALRKWKPVVAGVAIGGRRACRARLRPALHSQDEDDDTPRPCCCG